MTTATARSPKVLVVDDEENIRFLLSSALHHSGFEVATADNGREALTELKAFRPDAVLLDVMMPDIDGFEVCRRMRADGDRTAVIFLTAHDATEDKVRGLTLGGDDYVTKPFSLEEVIARVRVVVRRIGIDPAANSRLAFADLEMDEDAYRVWRGRRADRPVADRVQAAALPAAATPTGCCRGPRSSTTCGSTTSVAAANVVETYVSYLRKKLDNARTAAHPDRARRGLRAAGPVTSGPDPRISP